jgi:hypothetical protein
MQSRFGIGKAQQYVAKVRSKALPFISQRHPARCPVDQSAANPRLKRSDTPADRGLRYPKLSRRRTKCAAIGNCKESFGF